MGRLEINLVWQVPHLVALFLTILLLLPWLLIQRQARTPKPVTTASSVVGFQTALPRNAICLMVTHQEMRFTGSFCLLIFLDCYIDCCHLSSDGGWWQQGQPGRLLPRSAPSQLLCSDILCLLSGLAVAPGQRLPQQPEQVKIQGGALAGDISPAPCNSLVSPVLEERKQIHHCWKLWVTQPGSQEEPHCPGEEIVLIIIKATKTSWPFHSVS